jgi:hypothetical protein
VPKNNALIEAARRAAQLLNLPPLLLKAFMGVEGAVAGHRDGVLQVIPSTRAALIPRIARPLKLAALGLADDPALGAADLDSRFAKAFDDGDLTVQVLTGGTYIKEQLDRFNGFVALAGLAYNAGPGRANKEVTTKWGGDPQRAALQYHKRIGTGGGQVTVQAGIEQVDPATGARWTRFPVTANDSGAEIFQYLYLRQVPSRNFGLLDFIFTPSLLDRVGLFDDDGPPGEDRPDQALVAADGRFRQSGVQPTAVFHTLPLSQRDPRWKDVPLGFPDEGQTLGEFGCTLTCLTMMANGFGFQETPATLNDKLRALGPGQGFIETLVVWQGVQQALNGLSLSRLVECRSVAAPMAEIDAWLDAGKPVIVELDMSPSPGLQNHWVLIYARHGGDYLIHDPWTWPTESNASLVQRYGFSGGPARIITYCVFYDNPNFNPQPPQPAEPEELLIVVNDQADIRTAGGLALRDKPNAVGSQVKMRLPAGSTAVPLETADAVRQKVGVFNQWLQVSAQGSMEGYVAAWLVHVRMAAVVRAIGRDRSRRPGRQGLDPASAVQPRLRAALQVRVRRSTRSVGAVIRRRPRLGVILATARPGTTLTVLESARTAMGKIGRRGKWLKVRAGKVIGYVSATRVQSKPASRVRRRATWAQRDLPASVQAVLAHANEPDARPVLQVTAEAGLNLRDAPSTSASELVPLPYAALLLLREPVAIASPKIGAPRTWIAVTSIDGVEGFAAGEFVVLANELPPEPGALIDPQIKAQGVVLANGEATLHLGPAEASSADWRVTSGTPLRLLHPEDWDRLGQPGAFVEVESYAYKRGFVRATSVRAPDFPDRRQPVLDAPLPFGICAWLYGVHDAFDRGLFTGTGKTGWVLFTHRVIGGEGMNYDEWSKSGFGTIARLNNDYGGSGTIPTPDQYDVFADQCRRWVANSQGNLIWVIGNEMNNPREWPQQDPSNPGNNPNAAITPESYATCFNKVRAAIKSVQPGAIVVPGAVDPFQGPWMSCLDYFERMLAAITDLDGLALHSYTNGYTPDLITSLDRFANEPLRWQYLHFRSYSTFLDVIPPRYRARPVFITETDAHGATPWAGGQNGWVQAAYAEVDRYNWQAHAQQSQALILYRWSRDDAYSIVDKPGVRHDLRATIESTDYRWRR